MYFTNWIRDDGFGAQYQTIIYSAIYTEFFGYKFAYTPFSKIAHNYTNDPNFLSKKEELINLKRNFPSSSEVYPIKILPSSIYAEIDSKPDVFFSSKSFFNIKRLFWENKKKQKTNTKIIAVHIRRPNLHDIGTYGYSEDEYFLKAIETVKNKYNNQAVVHIYSQGENQILKAFQSKNFIFHLNESIEKTFFEMASADALIMSKGSFSYTAALMSEGEIFYLPFWHPPLSHWKII